MPNYAINTAALAADPGEGDFLHHTHTVLFTFGGLKTPWQRAPIKTPSFPLIAHPGPDARLAAISISRNSPSA